MRDIAVVIAFGWLAQLTLRHVWVGALLWTWISTMNPHKLTYGFAYSLPFAAAAVAVTFVSVIIHRKDVSLPRDLFVVVLLTFVIWTCITTAFAIHPEQSFDLLVDRCLKIQLMTLVCLATLRERKHIELFIWVLVVSLGFYGAKGGVFAIMTGGSARVWGPSGALIEGNNEIGLALVMAIPLMNYLRLTSQRPWVRRALLVVMGLSSVAAVSTQSRGAFLAIAAMGLVLWFRSQRKVIGGIFIGAVAISLLAFMPESWEARMRTIDTYQQDASAMGRINAWNAAYNVANDRITGAGFAIDRGDVFARYAPDPTLVLTAHSIYFQALGEQGWIGLGLFLTMGLIGFVNAARLRSIAKNRPETLWIRDLAGMIQVSMVGYGVGGAFLSLTYFDLPYNIIVILLASKYWLRDERWRTETAGVFAPGQSLSEIFRQAPARSAGRSA